MLIGRGDKREKGRSNGDLLKYFSDVTYPLQGMR